MALPSSPNDRKEVYLSNIAGQGTALPSEPHDRYEAYLDYIAKNGGGGGGTTVVANPSGTATDELTKIQIGQTIYDIEGGSGAEYTKEIIYDSGSETTFAPISSNATAFNVDVNFSKSVSNYDILEIWVNDEASGGISANVLPVYVDLETALAKVIDINGWDRRYVRFKIKTATTFAYFGTNPGGQGDVPRIFKIYGIKFGGGGGGTGDGDMKKSVYDGDLAVASAGGIKSYVTGAISGKVDKVQGKGLSTNDYDDSAKAIVDGVKTELDGKADQSDVDAILNGTNIDSFGDVETALAGKMPNYGIGSGLYIHTDTNELRADVVGLAIKDSTKAITSGAVYSLLGSKYGTADQLETELDGQDKFPFYDFSASEKRQVTFGSIKAKLKEYFDLFYTNLVSSATNGNFAGLDANGNLVDSGKKASDFATTDNVIANTKLIKDTVGWSGKNKWNIKDPAIIFDATTGLTYSVLEKGYQLSNSTASEWTSLKMSTASHLKANTDYKLSTYITITSGTARIIVSGATSQGGTYTNIVDSQNITSNGKAEVTFNTGSYTWFRFTIYATVGSSVTGNVKYDDFMIRPADILDDSFEPYFGSTAFPRSEQAVLGAKNVAIGTFSSSSIEGIAYTANSDNTIGVVAGSTHAQHQVNSTPFIAPVSGMFKYLGGIANEAVVFCWDNTSNSRPYTSPSKTTAQSNNSKGKEDAIPFYMEEGHVYQLICRVGANVEVTGTFYPMIICETDTDLSYAPPAMTNRELTEKVQGIIDAATNAADFAAFKTAIGNL